MERIFVSIGSNVDRERHIERAVDLLRARFGDVELSSTYESAAVGFEGGYPLVYLLWNTLFNLRTQDEQVRCFENVAAQLTAGGAFVVEVYVPSSFYRWPDHQHVHSEGIEVDRVDLSVQFTSHAHIV